MFNNLVESRSHTSELKRRGSFFLYTVAAYGLLFIGAGVGSIYAYDAHLVEPAPDLIAVLAPINSSNPIIKSASAPARTARSSNATGPYVMPERRSPMAATSDSLVPDKISTQPVYELPAPHSYKIGDHDRVGAGLPGSDANVGEIGSKPSGENIAGSIGAPPPAPVKKTAPPTPPILKRSYVLNSSALELPKPEYPAPARQIHLAGLVSVQVVIDENGKVISAHAASGHPLLAPAAVRAALRARFSPTIVGDTKVKVSGIINYNFVLE